MNFSGDSLWGVVVSGHLVAPRAHDGACLLGQREGGVSEFELSCVGDEREDRVDISFRMMLCFHESSSVLAHAGKTQRVVEKLFQMGTNVGDFVVWINMGHGVR